MSEILPTTHLHIGAIIFPAIDQIDFTGPFEILSRLPNSTFHVLWKDRMPLKDGKGLILTPDTTFAESSPLNLLVVPGGIGQEALMDDEVVLSFIREQAAQADYVLSVCTGALICGAAGLLRGKRAATHWNSFHLLEYFGAIPVNERVVQDGNFVFASGVTSGLDGALGVAALLRGDLVAQEIQLQTQYAPEPPFTSGTPETAPSAVLQAAQQAVQSISSARLATAQRIAARLGINKKLV
ncbi:MAG: DJ-1/PfpI family protein [Abitibacteriaceae bacterium]|nr:DJ-1/PfpI family protein [Abditibacteriaceae bacterium]